MGWVHSCKVRQPDGTPSHAREEAEALAESYRKFARKWRAEADRMDAAAVEVEQHYGLEPGAGHAD